MSTRLSIPSDCPHCHTRNAVTRPSHWWKVALGAGWVTLAAMVLGMAMAGQLGLALILPAVVLYGLGTLPFLHERASAPATCEACGKIVEPQTDHEATTRRDLTVVPSTKGSEQPSPMLMRRSA